MPAALPLRKDTQDLDRHFPALSKVINCYCKGAEKKNCLAVHSNLCQGGEMEQSQSRVKSD